MTAKEMKAKKGKRVMSVRGRVKRHRDNKKKSAEGIEELRAINRKDTGKISQRR